MVTIDVVREFWDRQPCNVRHSRRKVGSLEYFLEVSQRKYFVEPHIPGFANFSAWRDKRVLEVGCGIGTDAVSFALNNAEVTAVELSPVSLEIAKQHAEILGVQDRVQFVVADVESLSDVLQPIAYNLVYSFGVLHHTPNPSRALAEIQQFMDGDSVLKLMLYHRRSWKMLWILAAHWRPGLSMTEAISQHTEAQKGCPISHTFTRRMAREFLEDFEILEMCVEHIFPYRVRDYVQYRYRKALPWSLMPYRLFRWFEHRVGAHLLITARKKC